MSPETDEEREAKRQKEHEISSNYVKKRTYKIGLHHGGLNPLPANFRFPSMTFQQLIVNYLLGNQEGNIPPYSSLSTIFVNHNKSDARNLGMMKTLMNYVKQITFPKGLWYNRSSDWTYRQCNDLWSEVSKMNEFNDFLKKGNRNKNISWKTVYNRMSKMNVFKGKNKRRITLNNDIEEPGTLENVTNITRPNKIPKIPAMNMDSHSIMSNILQSKNKKDHILKSTTSHHQKSSSIVDRPTKKYIIKKKPEGSFVSKKCDYCDIIPTNHYCTSPKHGYMIFMEGNDTVEVCGNASCFECRGKWGDAEDFASRCNLHKN